jgi:FAD:protein FMN transferase
MQYYKKEPRQILRISMLKNVLFILFSFTLFTGCEEQENTKISRTQVIMGTFATLSLEEKDVAHIQKGFQYLKDIESILSSYKKDADVYQLNQKKQLTSNPTLKDILTKSKTYHTQTQGYFDITIGSITKALYHFGEAETIPTKEERDNAILGIDQISIQNEVIILGKDITVDLGGIGKGYAVDALSTYYHTLGIKKGQVALSGDIRCLDKCRVGIQDPYDEDKILSTLHAKVPNLSISTSGTYRRYVKSKTHHHLLNPKSKSQGHSFISVTIVTQADNTLSDVMATAIATMPKSIALKFVESQDNFGYILVTPEGKVIKGNLEKFVSYSQFKK